MLLQYKYAPCSELYGRQPDVTKLKVTGNKTEGFDFNFVTIKFIWLIIN
ncbi:hypothetical protein J2W55_004981 [Mucilaginibacter pocheonensis]|uniref:Uncharacterized protein n=1 Tax=Mucilaginibacter pocheonensis TaxID=398050 RepID=A0ABU1TIC7_9SPHI|nr:hypothetical protein [Mucilaginibacter pocheonensis]